jgi:hypothetical protein
MLYTKLQLITYAGFTLFGLILRSGNFGEKVMQCLHKVRFVIKQYPSGTLIPPLAFRPRR